MVENGGNASRALRDAGYSPAVVNHPARVVQTDSFQKLLDEMLPDAKLLKVQVEGLDATRIHGSMTEPDRVVPDYAVRHKYLETGFKLKKRLGNDGVPGVAVQVNIDQIRERYSTS